MTGASVGLPGYASATELRVFTVGVHGTHVRAGRVGVDYSAGTMPWVLVAQRLFVVGARAGAVLPLAVAEDVLLLPSAGGSVVGGLATGGAAIAEPGLNTGVAMLILGHGGTGLRVGATWHWFRPLERPLWLVEVGIVRHAGANRR